MPTTPLTKAREKHAQEMDAHTGLPILAMTELIAQLCAIGVVTKDEYLANSVL